MTSPFVYPPGQISTWGNNLALKNQDPWISYIGVDGTIFYLSGPMAPVAGAQDGLVLIKHMGLMSPFEMLEQRGARQDGASWNAAVYDVGEIMLQVEASGVGPQNIRDVIRHWISAWDAREVGKLSVYTPDMGEWWANVRMGKNISDEFTKNYTWNGRQVFTWVAKNYDAYWYSVDSTSSFAAAYESVSENFLALPNSDTLPAGWTTFLSPDTLEGTCGIRNGAATLIPSGNGKIYEAQNIYNTASDTDDQVVSIQFSPPTLADLFDILDPNAFIDIWARCNSNGTTGIRLRLNFETFSVTSFVNGEAVWSQSGILWIPPLWNETFTLLVGTETSPYNIRVLRDGFTIFNMTDSAGLSTIGADYRLWGFGLSSSIFLGNYILPQPIQRWSGADNTTVTESGYVYLTNIGDQPAWPRYLCYGPGTFTFNNGPGDSTPITFGPLEDGQIVLVTTTPRLRSVVDVTPNQPTQQQLNIWQRLLQELISFVTNNNVPPFLQQFESLFGITPPQGNLYTLLNGRFTNPIPATPYGVTPPTEQIKVTITDGSPVSKIVAAITPMRRWPL
ncbi:hypothetical protein MINTMi27_15190 [Mycobacterium intracellulare]|uniref:DUF7257 domain-containing protein n=1 Tax=Mycobacterium intracellulare TaxID=1767 RepID=UPI0019254AD3|nr:hypothetical protein [Mycobacterium intracellulare]BCP41426.1 hypothetical protein MINTMi27_15190 [Mycobacterium intracellulare]